MDEVTDYDYNYYDYGDIPDYTGLGFGEAYTQPIGATIERRKRQAELGNIQR